MLYINYNYYTAPCSLVQLIYTKSEGNHVRSFWLWYYSYTSSTFLLCQSCEDNSKQFQQPTVKFYFHHVRLLGTFCVVKWHITVNYNILLKVFSLLHIAMFKKQYDYYIFTFLLQMFIHEVNCLYVYINSLIMRFSFRVYSLNEFMIACFIQWHTCVWNFNN